MKKLTSFLQKNNGVICIVLYALLFVYAIGMATPAAPLKQYQDEITFYSAIMPYNNAILIMSIFGLLLSAFYFILRNNVRLVYYVSNFVWHGAYVGYTLASSIVTLISVITYQTAYGKLDFDTINSYFSDHGSNLVLRANTPVFVLGYLEVVFLILTIVPIVLVLLDKIKGRLRYEQNKKDGVANPVTFDPKEAK